MKIYVPDFFVPFWKEVFPLKRAWTLTVDAQWMSWVISRDRQFDLSSVSFRDEDLMCISAYHVETQARTLAGYSTVVEEVEDFAGQIFQSLISFPGHLSCNKKSLLKRRQKYYRVLD